MSSHTQNQSKHLRGGDLISILCFLAFFSVGSFLSGLHVSLLKAGIFARELSNRPNQHQVAYVLEGLRYAFRLSQQWNLMSARKNKSSAHQYDILYGLLGKIWEEEEMPQDWNESYIVKLPKKGDCRECKNYRGISLMSAVGKVLYRIILLRLQGAVDATLRDQQAGFRKDHSCIGQIATLRIIIEQSIEWNTSLYVNFINFEKAFDSLNRSVLWCLMRHYGIPGKFIRIIKNSYDKMTCRVLHASGLSDSFTVNTGVKQG